MPSARPRFAAAALALLLASPAAGQASHRVTLVVPAVKHLAVSADEVTLVFAAPVPGEPFADVVDASARYAVAVNTAGNKITGALDGPFPEGVRLAVRLAAPAGAASLGDVELGPDARDLVADVATVAASGLPVTYTASATEAAALDGPLRASRRVTFTITDQ